MFKKNTLDSVSTDSYYPRESVKKNFSLRKTNSNSSFGEETRTVKVSLLIFFLVSACFLIRFLLLFIDVDTDFALAELVYTTFLCANIAVCILGLIYWSKCLLITGLVISSLDLFITLLAVRECYRRNDMKGSEKFEMFIHFFISLVFIVSYSVTYYVKQRFLLTHQF
jgi:hypothetical protein